MGACFVCASTSGGGTAGINVVQTVVGTGVEASTVDTNSFCSCHSSEATLKNAKISHLLIYNTKTEPLNTDTAAGLASTFGDKVLYSTICETSKTTKFGIASADAVTDQGGRPEILYFIMYSDFIHTADGTAYHVAVNTFGVAFPILITVSINVISFHIAVSVRKGRR